MSLLTTFNGINVISTPCYTSTGLPTSVTMPVSIEWNPSEKVGETDASFGYQAQTFDWLQSMWTGQVSFPPMNRFDYDAWSSFILECRGVSNSFMMGDPKAAIPKGLASGFPVVSGAAQTGYSLVSRGWTDNVTNILYTGDYLQIGYRLYKVLSNVTSDSSGDATIAVWPNLRDQPADGTTIVTRNCRGLFRLAKNTDNKFSVNGSGSYGFSGFSIREAGVA